MLTPIPTMGEILLYLYEVCGISEPALRRKLDCDTPDRTAEQALFGKIVEMDDILGDAIFSILDTYQKIHRESTFAGFPAKDIRHLLATMVARQMRTMLGHDQFFGGSEISLDDWLPDPTRAVASVWTALQEQHGGPSRMATLLSEREGVGKDSEHWRRAIMRWQKGDAMSAAIPRVLYRMKMSVLARRLLIARGFRLFWERMPEKARLETARLWHGPDAGPAVDAFVSERMAALLDSAPAIDLSIKCRIGELGRLVQPSRPKANGDMHAAAELMAGLKSTLTKEQCGLCRLDFHDGLFHAQSGSLAKAVKAFDRDCRYQIYRNGYALRDGLPYATMLAACRNQSAVLGRWQNWCDLFDVGYADETACWIAFEKAFPHLYPEARPIPQIASFGRRAHILALDELERRRPNYGAPDQWRKGVGSVPKTQLMIAASLRKPDRVGKLLEKGADADLLDRNGGSALLCAVQSGCRESFDLLLDASSPGTIDSHTRKGKTPLSEALSDGHEDLADRLLQAGASPETGRDARERYRFVLPALLFRSPATAF